MMGNMVGNGGGEVGGVKPGSVWWTLAGGVWGDATVGNVTPQGSERILM